ncbi:MAG TPA: histidine phosphatase family protein [Gemmatimonadales bacterium]|nr:histidine phosphatase family protein [Gemmatimonadales bacterium]
MHLLIVRHAIAVPHGTSGVEDHDRPLTDDGRRKFRRVARGIAKLVRRPDALLTSPHLRARQTAELLAGAWKDIAPEPEEALATGDFAGLETRLASYRAEQLVAIVGHEPHLSGLLAHLVDARSPERFAFRKGGCAMVELKGALSEGGLLHWFARPRMFR